MSVFDKGSFNDTYFRSDVLNESPLYNLSLFYEKANDEYLTQQGNIDKVFTLFIAVMSLATPYTLTANAFDSIATTIVLYTIAVVSSFLTYIAIGYRKRALMCNMSMDVINILMNVKNECIGIKTVRQILYKVIKEKSQYYIITRKGKKKFFKIGMVLSVIADEESIYISIMSAVSSIVYIIAVYAILAQFGITYGSLAFNLWSIAIVMYGILSYIMYMAMYCQIVYCDAFQVVIDGSEYSFKKTYRQMKHIHFCYED